MIRKGQKPTAIHSNCSGKHAGILALCQLKGFSTIGYTDQSHPAQQLIRQTLSELAEAELSDADVAIDGCGVPTFLSPFGELGYYLLNLPQHLQVELIASRLWHEFVIL